jgi:hypothetical protein
VTGVQTCALPIFKHENDAAQLELELHLLAKELLKENKVEEAWLTLLAFNN